ncbi:MAG: 16S rRNA (uracil(1498)-N(3))-methyltransferase [Planctomycetaceae bacterium]|nr:16S rRNA (uracil(1498)-N(3))-methyltransferase [Planctomycetaceae bacterium]
MSRRFYSPESLTLGHCCLEGAEAHHLLRVMRAKVGDQVILFDGGGDEFEARVHRLGRNDVEFEILSQRAINRELTRTVKFAVALPRGDRSEWLTQKLVELGVFELTPWQTQRSVALPNVKTVQRLKRQVIEAAKQCGRNRLMRIEKPVAFEDHVVVDQQAIRLFAHPAQAMPDTDGPAMSLSELVEQGVVEQGVVEQGVVEQSVVEQSVNRSIVVGIGPEGGFTDDEVRQAQRQGWQAVDLGRRILRTETAALAMAAWLMLNTSHGSEN